MTTLYKDVQQFSVISLVGASIVNGALGYAAQVALQSISCSGWTWIGSSTNRNANSDSASATLANARLDTLVRDLVAKGILQQG